MSYTFLDPWHGFLPREGGHILSVMGSGGKTSFLLAMAAMYKQWNVPVVLTTTTRSEPLVDIHQLRGDELSTMVANDEDLTQLPDTFFLSNGLNFEGKLTGLTVEMIDDLGSLFPDRVILVEVDGSAKKPVKIHRQGEPVWPERTSLAFVVMGAAAVGEPVGEVVHRLGRQASKVFDEVKSWDILEWEHLQKALLSADGYLDQVPAEVPSILVLTGMDVQDDSIGLFSFVGQAMEDPRLPIVVFCDFGSENGEIRTSCREVLQNTDSENPDHD